MGLSPAIFLIIYGVFGFLAILWLFFNIYHLAKFGLHGNATKMIIAGYVFGFLAILLFSIFLMLNYDWSRPIPLSPSGNYQDSL